MKREEIKKIIQEETKAFLLAEGLIDSLVSLFIAPKLKKDIKKLKNSPEWKEWMQKLNSTRQEMEMYSDRLQARLDYLDDLEKNPEKYGFKHGVRSSAIKAMRNAAISGGKFTNSVLGRR